MMRNSESLRRRPRLSRSRSAALPLVILAAAVGAPSCLVRSAYAASVVADADVDFADGTGASGEAEAAETASSAAAAAASSEKARAGGHGHGGAGLGHWGAGQRSEESGGAESAGGAGAGAGAAAAANGGAGHWGTRTVEEDNERGDEGSDHHHNRDASSAVREKGGGGAFGTVPAKSGEGQAKQQASGDASGTAIPFVKLDVPDVANDTAPSSSTSTASTAAKVRAESGKEKGEGSEGAKHGPPAGFTLAAHVVTDPTDGLSYFVRSGDEGRGADADAAGADADDLLIPFLECGTVGSTTDKFPLRHGHFRHLPPGARPQTWTTTANSAPDRRRKDPQLLVALRPVELTVSGNGGGESRTFEAGDVVLLEDVVGRGHKLSPVGAYGLSVLLLTLPRHHHHHHHHHHQPHGAIRTPIAEDASSTSIVANAPKSDARRHLSILGLRRRLIGDKSGRGIPRPCRVGTDPAYSTLGVRADEEGSSSGGNAMAFLADGTLSRRTVLGAIGFGVSTFLTYFLYQVATPVLGILGVVSLFVGAAILFDGVLGALVAEVEGWIETEEAGIAVDYDQDEGDRKEK